MWDGLVAWCVVRCAASAGMGVLSHAHTRLAIMPMDVRSQCRLSLDVLSSSVCCPCRTYIHTRSGVVRLRSPFHFHTTVSEHAGPSVSVLQHVPSFILYGCPPLLLVSPPACAISLLSAAARLCEWDRIDLDADGCGGLSQTLHVELSTCYT